jgi:putative DNA primase/helicase
MNLTIPSTPPADRLGAARLLRDLGLVVHPLYGPHEGQDKERGKRPRLKGYRKAEFRGLTEDQDLVRYFGNGRISNVGVVVRPPHVIVDLDSKPDKGASVRRWLESRKDLAHVPREETAGGAHLHFICKDAPHIHKGVVKAQVNQDVSVEIFTGPANVVVSPSQHPSGKTYSWTATGAVPEVSWKFLTEVFHVEEKAERKSSTSGGNLASLDVVALAKALDIYGEEISGEDEKHTLRCPWEEDHSTKTDWKSSDTSTVVFPAKDGDPPGFCCLHAHCEGRGLGDFVRWCNLKRPGVVDEFCTETKADTSAGFPEDLVERHGDPFIMSEKGKVAGIGESFWAGLYAHENTMLWEPEERRFYAYEEDTGLYVPTTPDALKRGLSDLLLREGRSRKVENMGRWRTDTALNHLVAHMRGITERRGAFAERPPAVHLANGVIDFSGGGASLVEFSPHFYSRNASPIRFDEAGDCPRFLDELVRPAVHEEDVTLLQRYAGLCLLGRNLVQRILILDGLAGRGKSTFSSILQRVVGSANCTQLRTALLAERFETARYLGKTLLVGVDVDPDFLRTKGASVLKGLVGGDNFDTETKGGTDSCKLKGDFLVIITANSRLHVRLQRDIDAWRRRLLIVRYEGPPPAKKIPDLADHLVKEEGAGILNWSLAGLHQVLSEVETYGDLVLTPRQTSIVNSLLEESESLKVFLTDCVEKKEGTDVSVAQIMEAYFEFCPGRGWEPLTPQQAQAQLPHLMLELFRVSRRNDIKRGTSVRGFSGVGFKSGAVE